MPSANEPHAAGVIGGVESRTKSEPTVLVRKLGAAEVPTYLERVLTEEGEHQFVVVERLPRSGMTDDEASECVREARLAADLEHPNVVRTRAVSVRTDEISVMTDYVAGERLSELWSLTSGSTHALPIEVALRILVDAASGLGALHKLRSADGHERVKFVHGEMTDSNVLVGLDGVSMVLRGARARRRGARPALGAGTIAPEVVAGEPLDQRADVYSLGAMLWQALSGRPLTADHDLGAMLTTAKEGTVSRAVIARGEPWALPLADVAAKALSPVPEKRFPTASSMVTELRKIAGAKLATAIQVAEFVEAAAGAKIAARLADVQASAVIRKATSIPAPRASVPAEAPPRAERDSAPKLHANDDFDSAPTRPTSVAARPQEPSSAGSKRPINAIAASSDAPRVVQKEEQAALPRVRAVLPAPSELPTLVKPKAASPIASVPVPAAPSKPAPPPSHPVAAPSEPVAASHPAPATNKPAPATGPPVPATSKPAPAMSNPAPATSKPAPATNKPAPATSKPAPATNKLAPATSKPAPASSKSKGERARADSPRVVAKAAPLVPASGTTRSLLTRPGAKWAIAAWLTIAMITGWFAWQAVLNRQDIATPGSVQDSPAAPAPAPTPAAEEAAHGTPRPGAVAPVASVQTKPVPAPTASARPRPAVSSEPRKPVADAHTRPRDVTPPKESAPRPPDTKPRQK